MASLIILLGSAPTSVRSFSIVVSSTWLSFVEFSSLVSCSSGNASTNALLIASFAFSSKAERDSGVSGSPFALSRFTTYSSSGSCILCLSARIRHVNCFFADEFFKNNPDAMLLIYHKKHK